jgi:prolyl oligopeptidase
MAAKLQAIAYQAYFYEPTAGGHGYVKDKRERASLTALGYNLLRRHRLDRQLGPGCGHRA